MYKFFRVINKLRNDFVHRVTTGVSDVLSSVGALLAKLVKQDSMSYSGTVTWLGYDEATDEKTVVSAHNDITDVGLAVLGTTGLGVHKNPELVNADKIVVVTPNKYLSSDIQYWGTVDSALTQVLLANELNLSTSSRIAPIYTTTGDINSENILAYASNRRSESGKVGYQSALKTVSDILNPLSTTVSRMYPAECGTGTIKGIVMMTGFKDGKILRGYAVYKGVDKYDELSSDCTSRTKYMIKPGMTGLTAADEIIFGGYDSTSNKYARYKFNLTTGKYSEADMSLYNVELPLAHTNQFVANNKFIYLSGSTVKALDIATKLVTTIVSNVTGETLFSDGTYGYYASSASTISRFNLTTLAEDEGYSLSSGDVSFKDYWGTQSTVNFSKFVITNFGSKYMVVHRGDLDASAIPNNFDYSTIAGVVINDFEDWTSTGDSFDFYPANGSYNYANVTVGGTVHTLSFEDLIVPSEQKKDSLSIGGIGYTSGTSGIWLNLLSGNLVSYQTPEGGSFEKTDTTYLEVLYTYGVSRVSTGS